MAVKNVVFKPKVLRWNSADQPIEVDDSPANFYIASKSNVALNSDIASDDIDVTGYDSAPISASEGAEYSIDGGEWTSVPGTITYPQVPRIQGHSSGENADPVTVTLFIGNKSAGFTFTTLASEGSFYRADDFSSGIDEDFYTNDAGSAYIELSTDSVGGNSSEKVQFNFYGDADDTVDARAQLAFDLGSIYDEVDIEFDWWIPANYSHVVPSDNINNNKLFRLWQTLYTDLYHANHCGASTVANAGESSLTTECQHFGEGVGPGPGDGDIPYTDFITDADKGTWLRVRIHAMAPTIGNSDGFLRVYKNGTLTAHNEELPAIGTGSQGWRYGNLLGAANSGFREDTIMYIDNIVFNGRSADGVISSFLFNAGDTYADVKGGMSFESTGWAIGTAPGTSETGGIYQYTGYPNPEDAGLEGEQRFDMNPIDRFYIKRRIFIPDNYFHRRPLGLVMSTSIAGWQVGDIVRGVDGTSTGSIEYISGSKVYLNYATLDYDNAVWVGTLTNVTRSTTATCTSRQVFDTGQKHFVLFCDGYSTLGKGPTIIFGLTNTPGDPTVSNINFSIGTDGSAANMHPNQESLYVPYITSAHLGKWVEEIIYVEPATDEFTYDGRIAFWARIDGEPEYENYLDKTNCNNGFRAASTPPYCQFSSGYCFGNANGGYQEDTTFYEAEFTVSRSPIDGVS